MTRTQSVVRNKYHWKNSQTKTIEPISTKLKFQLKSIKNYVKLCGIGILLIIYFVREEAKRTTTTIEDI